MQRNGMTKRHWSLIGSAITGTVICIIVIGAFIYSVFQYMETEEMLEQFASGVSRADVWAEMILGTLITTSPMLIGAILNWIGALARKRPLLLVAGLMYLVNGMLDLMFLLYCIIPAVMAFVAFYQMNRTPRLKPPRLI